VIFEVVLTSIDRTAYPRFARMVSAQELTDAFTPAGDEVVWAREKTTTGQHLLALVVRLKCYQRLGYFPQLDEVPDSVVGHIRGLLGLSGEVAAQVEANRTASGTGSSCATGSAFSTSPRRCARSPRRRSGRRRPRTTRPT
jgi:uncharacterized protein DUF4158